MPTLHFQFLRVLLKKATFTSPELLPEQLEYLCIELEDLDLETGQPQDDGPLFRVPYSKERFLELFNEDIYIPGLTKDGPPDSHGDERLEFGLTDVASWAAECSDWARATIIVSDIEYLWGADYFPRSLAHHTNFKKRPQDFEHNLERMLHSRTDRRKEQWTAVVFFDTGNVQDPLACLLHMGADMPDNVLFRGEAICAITLLAHRNSKRDWKGIPSFVYTVSGHKTRVLNAYFDVEAKKVIIRKSKTISMKGPEQLPNLQLMFRWMMNVPPDHQYATR